MALSQLITRRKNWNSEIKATNMGGFFPARNETLATVIVHRCNKSAASRDG